MWCTIEEISEDLGPFKGWKEEFPNYLKDWEEYCLMSRPFEMEAEDLPGKITKEWTLFHRIIACNILAPDKIIPGVSYLIS